MYRVLRSDYTCREMGVAFKTYSEALCYATNTHNRFYKTSGKKIRFRIIKEDER